jgi:hypothetical protein
LLPVKLRRLLCLLSLPLSLILLLLLLLLRMRMLFPSTLVFDLFPTPARGLCFDINFELPLLHFLLLLLVLRCDVCNVVMMNNLLLVVVVNVVVVYLAPHLHGQWPWQNGDSVDDSVYRNT